MNKIVIISGPTGVGETTITKKLIELYPEKFVRLVTATTRKKRKNEKHGVDYYFFSNQEFKKQIELGNILEWQNSRDKNVYYGTYAPDLFKKLEKGFIVLVNTDITGTKFFKKNFNAISIFILPESMEVLKKQHLQRNPKIDKLDLEKRLAYAKYEIENEADFYDYQIVNKYGKIEETVNKIISILKSERFI